MISLPFATLESSVIGNGGNGRIIVYPLVVWEIILGILIVRRTMTVVER